MQGCQFLKILKNNTWSHFLDKNVVSMPKGIKFGSWEVRAKACHKSMGTLKIKELCAVLPLIEIFEKNNTWSHFADQNVVPMRKGIKSLSLALPLIMTLPVHQY